tara:strand:- start:195 stop:545 length:351 start_codon:yes stop_codon:yes gene_type:complete
MIHKIEAIISLDPNARVSCNEDSGEVIWHSQNNLNITDTQIKKELERLTAAEPMRKLREQRNQKLAETDHFAFQDRIMTEEMKTYRQALRDLPATVEPQLDDAGNLTNVTWPEVSA